MQTAQRLICGNAFAAQGRTVAKRVWSVSRGSGIDMAGWGPRQVVVVMRVVVVGAMVALVGRTSLPGKPIMQELDPGEEEQREHRAIEDPV